MKYRHDSPYILNIILEKLKLRLFFFYFFNNTDFQIFVKLKLL